MGYFQGFLSSHRTATAKCYSTYRGRRLFVKRQTLTPRPPFSSNRDGHGPFSCLVLCFEALRQKLLQPALSMHSVTAAERHWEIPDVVVAFGCIITWHLRGPAGKHPWCFRCSDSVVAAGALVLKPQEGRRSRGDPILVMARQPQPLVAYHGAWASCTKQVPWHRKTTNVSELPSWEKASSIRSGQCGVVCFGGFGGIGIGSILPGLSDVDGCQLYRQVAA